LRTFGDGCPEVFVIQAFMQCSHFWGYRSNNFFNSIRWAEDTSPKVILLAKSNMREKPASAEAAMS